MAGTQQAPGYQATQPDRVSYQQAKDRRMPRLAAIILAGGLSTRMGGFPKALLTFQTPLPGAAVPPPDSVPASSPTFLSMAADCFKACGIADIVAVTGHEHEAVAAHARALGLCPVYNPRFTEGMFTSVQAGLNALCDRLAEPKTPPAGIRADAGNAARPLPAPPDAVFILPVDAPLVQPSTVAELVRFWQIRCMAEDTMHHSNDFVGAPGWHAHSAILIPAVAGRTGHPPLVGSGHFSALAAWTGQGGLRGYFASLLAPETAAALLAGRVPQREEYRAADSPAPALPNGACPPPASAGKTQTNIIDGKKKNLKKSTVLHCVSVPDAGILTDIDTPEDIEAARKASGPLSLLPE